MADEGSAVDESDTVTYHVKYNQSDVNRVLNIVINENYYEAIDPDHTISWSYLSIDQGMSDYDSLELNNQIAKTDYKFTLEKENEGNIN